FNPWYRMFRPPLKRWIDRLAIRTAVSEDAAELAQLSFEGDYEIVPNGVDVPQFAKATPWPTERPTILFVGRHEPRKGLGVLRGALRRLLDDASRRAELVASGEQRAAEFSMRHVAERFIELYEAAIERSAVTR